MTENFQDFLKELGLKATSARLAVLTVFSCARTPINAEHIFLELKKEKIDLVTVYRTLSAFEKAGIIKLVDLRQDSLHYELSESHHHHIICKECGGIIQNIMCEVDKITKQFANISEHSLELFGLCAICVKNGQLI